MPTDPVQRAEFAIKSGLLTSGGHHPAMTWFEPHTRAREAEGGLRIHVRRDGLTGTASNAAFCAEPRGSFASITNGWYLRYIAAGPGFSKRLLSTQAV
jgi:hypothetical protein